VRAMSKSKPSPPKNLSYKDFVSCAFSADEINLLLTAVGERTRRQLRIVKNYVSILQTISLHSHFRERMLKRIQLPLGKRLIGFMVPAKKPKRCSTKQ
jgi:hypothetical protein